MSRTQAASIAKAEEDGLRYQIQSSIPLYWRSEPAILIELVGRGVRMPTASRFLAEAETRGWIEFRPATLSRPEDRCDIELPVLDEDRAKIRQVRRTRLLLTPREEAELNGPPLRVVSMEEAAKRERQRHEQVRTAPPLWMRDPVRATVIELTETVNSQSSTIASLATSVEALSATVGELRDRLDALADASPGRRRLTEQVTKAIAEMLDR